MHQSLLTTGQRIARNPAVAPQGRGGTYSTDPEIAAAYNSGSLVGVPTANFELQQCFPRHQLLALRAYAVPESRHKISAAATWHLYERTHGRPRNQ